MFIDHKPFLSWPGIGAWEEFSYVASHGTTPGVWSIVSVPQPASKPPAAFGNLTFGDGVNPPVTLFDCKAFGIDVSYSKAGYTWTVKGYDRRWRWRNQFGGFGGTRGRFNRPDSRWKLVPWSIRSPYELAELFLKELGEANYLIDLPAGLTKAFGANVDHYFRAGENVPPSNCNPYFNLDYTPPADALTQLAEMFGRHVVFCPVTNRVIVATLGEGSPLPSYPFEVAGPSLTDPNAPRAVGVAGAPIRIQARFRLEPVGEEWDGTYLPIDQLSYAPKTGADQPRKMSIGFEGDPAAPDAGPVTGAVVYPGGEIPFSFGGGASSSAGIAAILVDLNADPNFADNFTYTTAGGRIVITPKDPELDYSMAFETPDPPLWAAREDQPRKEAGRGWQGSFPPHFRVTTTSRLSHSEALSLAQKTVFRYYRVVNADPNDPSKPLTLPWFGKIDRVQQVTIQPTKVEQVVPQPRIAGGVNKGDVIGAIGQAESADGVGVLPEFYNGYSRDQQATVTGSVMKYIGQVFWAMPSATDKETYDHNTKPTQRVFVPFQVTQSPAADQLVIFAEPVFAWNPVGKNAAYIRYPELTLETACVVTDAATDQVVRYERVRELIGGTAPAEWHLHEDCAVGVVGEYDDVYNVSPGDGAPADIDLNRFVKWHFARGDKEHADAAADSYLSGHARKYATVDAETRRYVGVYPIDPDGAILQVSWSIGKGGATTVASRGSEHSPVVVPYPVRRRAELMSPDRQAAAANRAERALTDRLYPRPGGSA